MCVKRDYKTKKWAAKQIVLCFLKVDNYASYMEKTFTGLNMTFTKLTGIF